MKYIYAFFMCFYFALLGCDNNAGHERYIKKVFLHTFDHPVSNVKNFSGKRLIETREDKKYFITFYRFSERSQVKIKDVDKYTISDANKIIKFIELYDLVDAGEIRFLTKNITNLKALEFKETTHGYLSGREDNIKKVTMVKWIINFSDVDQKYIIVQYQEDQWIQH